MPFVSVRSARDRNFCAKFPHYPDLPRPLDPMMGIAKTGLALGISESTVRRLIKAGKLKAHRVGGQLRIAEEDLRAFLDSACL